MITEAIMNVFFSFTELLVSLVPSSDPPSWLSDGSGALAEIWGYGHGLGAWLPWSLIGVVFPVVIACIGLGLLIKLTRIVLSFLTLGGGSAA